MNNYNSPAIAIEYTSNGETLQDIMPSAARALEHIKNTEIYAGGTLVLVASMDDETARYFDTMDKVAARYVEAQNNWNALVGRVARDEANVAAGYYYCNDNNNFKAAVKRAKARAA